MLCLLFVFAAAMAPAADVPLLSGNWQVHITIGSYDNVIVCSFTQKADALTGNCGTPDNGTAPLAGTITGDKVAWSYKTTYDGGPVTPTYQGTLDSTSKPSKVTGTIDVPELAADGVFTATPSPQ